MTRASIFLVALLVLLGSCSDKKADEAGAGANSPSVTLSAVRQAEQEQLAAMSARNVDEAISRYTPDATLVVPGSDPLVGLDAIGKAFKIMLNDSAFAYDMTSSQAWISESGDLAVTTGDFANTYTQANGQPATIVGKNQTVWQKIGTADWKIVSDFNIRATSPDSP